MNIDVWLPPVLATVSGALLSPSVGKGLVTLAGARAGRMKHVPVEAAELYANGVPMDEAQFRAAFAAYQAELDTLPPPAERDAWQTAQQHAANAGKLYVAYLLPLGLKAPEGCLRLTVAACPQEHLLFSCGTNHDNGGRVSFIDLAWTGTEQFHHE